MVSNKNCYYKDPTLIKSLFKTPCILIYVFRQRMLALNKMNNGIGKAFLDTIRQTQKIRNTKSQSIDPRSAARTPAANKIPKYKLRYQSPVWASPSRDTYHAR